MVTFESEEHITACLNALISESAGWLREIVVVDNASTDRTADVVQGFSERVRLLVNNENVGFGRAMNQGVSLARGEYVLVLNPDCVLQTNCLDELVTFLEWRSQSCAAGPMISGTNGQFHYGSRRGFPTPLNSVAYLLKIDRLFPRNKMLGGYQMRFEDPHVETSVDCLSGACMLVRANAFREVGGFDEEYFLFGEDIDLCWKLREKGWEIWYVPSAQVRHAKGASMRKSPDRAQREFYESMRLFQKKRLSSHYGSCAMAAVRLGIDVAQRWARLRSGWN